jgi:hypothetical protein
MSLRDIMLAKTLSSGGSGGGGGVSSWNDLTDKPFGEKIFVEILPETAFQIDSANGNTTIETSATLQEGKEYTVIFDNVEYNCTAYDSQGVIAVGNETIVGGTNGDNEPFVFADLNGAWMVVAQSVGSHTISVAGAEEQQLDEKYIPDTIARKDDISWNNLNDKPFGEVTEEVLPERTFDFTSAGYDSMVGYYYHYDRDKYANFVVGAEYIVTWDGVEYRTVADRTGGLGNKSNTELPVIISQGSMGAMYYYTKEQGTHSVGVRGDYTKQLDEMYIPDTIARVSDLGDIETALDNIIVLQNTAIGGGA